MFHLFLLFSGDVTESEMRMSEIPSQSSSTNFTCGTHFYEQVDDCKDSVWVVQVSCGGLGH